MKELFPKNQSFHTMEKRCPEYYKVIKTQTEWFRKSAKPSMIKMLKSMPVNHALLCPYHCDNNKQ